MGRTRYTQSRFKLLDNSDGVSSYQTLSPKDVMPSPLLSSSSPSPHSHQTQSSSVSLSEYQSTPSRLYERSRLTPLAPPTTSSRSPSPYTRSPSSPLISPTPSKYKQTNNKMMTTPNIAPIVVPAVARSLKNIAPSTQNNSISGPPDLSISGPPIQVSRVSGTIIFPPC